MERKCPKCGSTRIDEIMSFYGPMYCLDCGFRVEDKTKKPNPFFSAAEEETAAQESEGPEAAPQSLGAALYEWSKTQ
jgi:transcription initiation factor TFIIIB Brf1 subunit/transcription initiation factor TFIIB